MFTEVRIPIETGLKLDLVQIGAKTGLQLTAGQTKLMVYQCKLDILPCMSGDTLVLKMRSEQTAMVSTLHKIFKNAMIDIKQGYVRTVTLYYVHFPSTFRLEPRVLNVSNFRGYKSDIPIKIPSEITILPIRNNSINISAPSRVTVLNFIHAIKHALKSATGKLDKRVFLDTIYVETPTQINNDS